MNPRVDAIKEWMLNRMLKPIGRSLRRLLIWIGHFVVLEFGFKEEEDPVAQEGFTTIRFGGPSVKARNWEEHWVGYLTHWATGFIAATGMLTIPVWQHEPVLFVPFLTLSFLVATRQTVEFLRRGDTPGRDIGDHIRGVGAGLVTGVALLAFVI